MTHLVKKSGFLALPAVRALCVLSHNCQEAGLSVSSFFIVAIICISTYWGIGKA